MPDNFLYYGDNLDVLRRHIKDESVDLEYLDPPFNSKATYNVLFGEQNGSRAAAQIKAFDDTWTWDRSAAQAYQQVVEAGGKVSQAMQAFRAFLGDNDMLAYLAMMAPRLVELRRVLKPTGSIYLHCDPTASHYLKMLLDAVFSPENSRNEIIWKRMTPSGFKGKSSIGQSHDVILCYSKSGSFLYNPIFTTYSARYMKERFNKVDENGRRFKDEKIGTATTQATIDRLIAEGKIYYTSNGKLRIKHYLDEIKGVPLDDVWTDIPPINSQAQERLGYPTQNFEALLERIILASSPPDGLVLDSFCGCGTTITVGQRTGRRWIGIDITHLAIGLMKHRLLDAFGDQLAYQVIGEPVSLPDAEALASSDPYQFQWWALGLVGARPVEQKKGSDKGIDGRLYFHDEAEGGKTKQVVLSVKAGHTSVVHVHELRGVIEREKAEIGVLITMQEPTRPMRTEVAGAGYYYSPGWNQSYPKLQILTVAELLAGQGINMPPLHQVNVTFRKAPKAQITQDEQTELEI